ncbi:LmbE-like protein [Backusella circina FSU 941]|nr:LmbE-like protein [Backusella circina FSU 941]
MILLSLSVVSLFSILLYAYHSIAYLQTRHELGRQVLILTAHPDDECMFFGPTITSLLHSKSRLHLLCLSTGNADGLGDVRKRELRKSGQILGISHIKSMDHPDLQDGMKNQWDAKLIAEIVKDYATKHKIDTIITFDDKGVSGHANHIACYKGANQASGIQLYRLVSIPLVRKYIGVLDLLLSMKDNTEMTFISPPLAYLLTHKAMRQHNSQLVWFRWLYVTFSRFMFINHLEDSKE